jgi:phosphoribosylanthranilate isomerase
MKIKICGITSIDDARACADLGIDAIGINFVPGTPRCVDAALARDIVRSVPGLLVVGVVANESIDAMRRLVEATGIGCLQLHGDESAETVAALLPHAYKAVRVADADDVVHARQFPGEHLLVDAKVEGALGGTGTTLDWSLVRELAKERRLTLAGGLNPDNVARAIAEVGPYCVDVSSGVERSPRIKDRAKLEAFVLAARAVRPA